jgi:class 3 adenylate cyclase/tetratricopeptide (TPR) repeat protein
MNSYQSNSKQAINTGDLLAALDLASQGLVENPDSAELLHTKALATLQILGPHAAGAILDASTVDMFGNVELLCLRARIQKELWLATGDTENIRLAAQLYGQASGLEPDNGYPAINAATCMLLGGEDIQARQLAARVVSICERKIGQEPSDFYAKITLAEALAVQGEIDRSRAHYAETAALDPGRIRDLASAHRQARLIAAVEYGDPAVFDSAFPKRRVLVMDHELIHKGESRFEPLTTDQRTRLESALAHRLSESLSTIGFACPTSMTEFLFIELLQQRNIRYHVFLPWSEHDLLGRLIPPAEHQRFRNILSGAESVRVLSQAASATSEVSSHYSEMVMIGVATLMAQALDLELEFLVLNDSGNPLADQIPEGPQSIKSILFADITDYSSLPERAIPNFVQHFMHAIARLIDTSENQVLISNTWGDALYLVFEDPESAGRFALELQSLVNTTDWASRGLPENFGIRIGLHAGPVYSIVDPVIKRPSFTGFHVSWAARIEPRAAPNSIYTSEEFAAMAALNEHSRLKCDYVGLLPLPKNFGEKRVYRLQSRGR